MLLISENGFQQLHPFCYLLLLSRFLIRIQQEILPLSYTLLSFADSGLNVLFVVSSVP
jgi:hypothetical protein